MTIDNTTDRRVPDARRVDVLRFPPQEKVWWTTTVSRFLVIPTTVTVILATGVYWIHRLPAGEPPPDETRGSIQVRLLAAPKLLPVIAHEEGNAPAQQRAPIAKVLAPNADDLGVALSPLPPTAKIDAAEAFPAPDSAALLSQSSPSDAVTRFQQILLRRLALVRQYPVAARQARLQGTVQIAFVMRRDGKVLDAWIGASSGVKILDREAIDMVWRARPLPAVPAGLPDPLSIKLPVAFTLPP